VRALALTAAAALLLCRAAHAGPDLRIAVASDARGKGPTGINTKVLEPILKHIKAEAPDLVVFPGDLVTGHVKPRAHQLQLETFRGLVRRHLGELPFYALLGNHESGTAAHIRLFRQTFPAPQNGPRGYRGLTYFVRRGGVLLVMLTTDLVGELGMISDRQMAWLERTLAANSDAAHIYVFGHHPAFPAGKHVGMSLDQYPERRDRFWALLRKHRVDAYFCGHEHLYNMTVRQGIYQFILGSAGAKLYRGFGGEFHHYAVVDVEGAMTRVTVKDETGKVRRQYKFRRRSASELLTIGEVDAMPSEQILAALRGADDVLAWKAAWSAWRRRLFEVMPAIIARGRTVVDFKNHTEAYMLIHALRALKFMPTRQGLPLIRAALKTTYTTILQEAQAAMAAVLQSGGKVPADKPLLKGSLDPCSENFKPPKGTVSGRQVTLVPERTVQKVLKEQVHDLKCRGKETDEKCVARARAKWRKKAGKGQFAAWLVMPVAGVQAVIKVDGEQISRRFEDHDAVAAHLKALNAQGKFVLLVSAMQVKDRTQRTARVSIRRMGVGRIAPYLKVQLTWDTGASGETPTRLREIQEAAEKARRAVLIFEPMDVRRIKLVFQCPAPEAKP